MTRRRRRTDLTVRRVTARRPKYLDTTRDKVAEALRHLAAKPPDNDNGAKP